LRDALVLSEQIKDDQTRKFVQAELRTQFAQDDALIEQENRILIDNVEQFLAVPGNTLADLPPEQFGRLRPVDRAKYMAGQRQQDEMTVMEQVARNPSLVAEGDWLERNRNKMTHATFVRLMAERTKPEKIIEAQVDADDINRLLVDFGMDRYVGSKPGTKEQQASLIFRNNVTQMIEVRQRERGGKISPDEKREIIRKAIVDEAYVSIAWASDRRMPVSMMTQEELGKAYYDIGDQEIPIVQYRVAEKQLMRAGIATPTESQILEYWTRKGKPK
jgi:hypothetical protein